MLPRALHSTTSADALRESRQRHSHSRSRSSRRTGPHPRVRLLAAQHTQQLRPLLGELERVERKLESCERDSGQEFEWNERKLEIVHALGPACGYQSGQFSEESQPLSPWTIASDFGCSMFLACRRFGRSYEQQNDRYLVENHFHMVLDEARVVAFEQAIARVVSGRMVLDVGSGAFCLLGRIALKAGAAIVHTVEQSEVAVQHAVQLFKLELTNVSSPPVQCLRKTCAALCPERMELVLPPAIQVTQLKHRTASSEAFVSTADGTVSVEPSNVDLICEKFDQEQGQTQRQYLQHQQQSSSSQNLARRHAATCSTGSLRCTVLLKPHTPGIHSVGNVEQDLDQHRQRQSSQLRAESPAVLEVHQGLSTELPLLGPYEVVVHEIFGHVASSEGAAAAMADLMDRHLCSPSCIFIPAAAGTLFAPTSELDLNLLEQMIHCFQNGGSKLVCQTKYNTLRFDRQAFLAPAQTFEWLEFSPSAKLRGLQMRTVEFFTTRDGVFDGLHFHMLIQLDATTEIDTLEADTTWTTTYVKLVEDGVWLKRGSRIVCECCVWLERRLPRYSVSVSHGEPGHELPLADFSWEGCS